jgi:serine/threonine protein kinase
MDKKSAEEEIELLKGVERIDPRGHYHWKLIKVCPAPKTIYDWPSDESGRPCSHYFGPKAQLLYFPYGGPPFSDFVNGFTVFDLRTLWAVRRLFLGLRVFQRNGFIHGDIKPDNMVYVASRDSVSAASPYYIKYIDFSLSFTMSKFGIPYEVYDYWPPEAILMSPKKTDDECALKSYAKQARVAALTQATSMQRETIETNFERAWSEGKMRGWLEAMKQWHRDESSLKEIAREKFDVYGLGVCLMGLHTHGFFSADLRSNRLFMAGLEGLAQRGMAFDARDRPSGAEFYSMYKDLLSTSFSQETIAGAKRRAGPMSIPPSIRPLRHFRV